MSSLILQTNSQKSADYADRYGEARASARTSAYRVRRAATDRCRGLRTVQRAPDFFVEQRGLMERGWFLSAALLTDVHRR